MEVSGEFHVVACPPDSMLSSPKRWQRQKSYVCIYMRSPNKPTQFLKHNQLHRNFQLPTCVRFLCSLSCLDVTVESIKHRTVRQERLCTGNRHKHTLVYRSLLPESVIKQANGNNSFRNRFDGTPTANFRVTASIHVHP